MPKDVWALGLVHWGGVLWHSTEQLALVWVHSSETVNLLAIIGHWTTVGDETFVPHKQYDFIWLKSLFCVRTVFLFCWMSKFAVFWFFTLTFGKVMDLSDMTRNTCHSGTSMMSWTRAPQGFVHTWNWTLGPTVSGPPQSVKRSRRVKKYGETHGNSIKALQHCTV